VFVLGPASPVVLHADLDAFYASVEQRDDPALRGRPVIVGGGVVLAASYEARARGVRTAMGGGRARALCPEAIVVRPRFAAYSEASREVFEILRRFTPELEPLSIDEAFLDVGGLEHILGPPPQIAGEVRRTVRAEVGLAITVGLASTKFLAKVASAVAKPDGLLIVPPGGEQAFLRPLPLERLWGVGAVTAGRLRGLGLRTVADVADLDEATLVALLGAGCGRRLHALAHNRDPRRVRAVRRRRSIGAQHALGRRRRSRRELDTILLELVDRVARRLRAATRRCRTVVLRLRFSDYARATRSRTLREATDRTRDLVAAARSLLAASVEIVDGRGLTLIGVALTNLVERGAVQLVLPLDRFSDLDATVDEVRRRFGPHAVARGSLLGRPVGDGPEPLAEGWGTSADG
jgi:DNA polymerase-4